MGDLISRSALIEAIKQHGKDIKSDVPMIEDIYQTAHKHIIDLVEIQPTAFDAEKVVAELEEEKQSNPCRNTQCKDCQYTNQCYEGEQCYKVGFDNAIEIVRKGGVDHD